MLWAGSCLLTGCKATYHLKLMDAFTNCPAVYQPAVTTATYTAQIDFLKKHFSGLFVFKAINDTTERVVFMNETGFKFMDLEFGPNHFTVQYMVSSLNKEIIVNTLKRDLGLLVKPPAENSARLQMPCDTCVELKFPQGKGFYYYTSDKACFRLQKIETGNDRKKSIQADLSFAAERQPATINIADHRMRLTLFMKKISN